MTRRDRFGFTLVELLVVITIISMLMALLIPAVMMARAKARVVTCTNQQKELGSAVVQYDTAKRRLPGYVNLVNGKKVGWVPVLFPFLGRMDLWEGTGGWRSGTADAAHTVLIKQLVCPNDLPTAAYPLSYVVNTNVLKDYSAAGSTASAISLANVKSPSQTVLLSEMLDPTRRYDTSLTPAQLGFGAWPPPTDTTTLVTKLFFPDPTTKPPPHRGIVLVTFCDGRVEAVADDITCSTYVGVP